MKAGRYLLAPWWLLQLATGARAFSDNPLLGSAALNARGLHVARVRLAHRLAERRRRRLARLVTAAQAADFARDGFVLMRDFLPPDEFARLHGEALSYRGPAREMIQGDTVTRRIALDGPALRAMPAARALLRRPGWRDLIRYVGSADTEPLTYIQTILTGRHDAPPDPQTALHADTFHPTVKAWLFLTDVAADEGPFVYVPGSHRATPARLKWERAMSIRASGLDRLSQRGSPRIDADDLPGLGLPAPVSFAVPANTLIVADTFGFHARGPAARPSMRLEMWAYGRRNPFVPWTGLDLAGLPGIAERRVPWLWAARDWLERKGWGGQPWADVGHKRATDE